METVKRPLLSAQEIQKMFEKGDYSRIARIFAQRHDGKDITASYVRMVLLDSDGMHDSSSANEIREIAEQYFTVKEEFNRLLIEG